MSNRFVPPIAARYLAALALATATWCVLYLGFTLLVDPFGVSPLKVEVPGVNLFKPRRADIDRMLKPYEVWRDRPKTVFLGTSRIHQSLDPRVLDGTRLAPAYNASIPASSLGLNVVHLRQYLELDPELRTVVIELFLYNFLGQEQEHESKSRLDFLRDSGALFVSGDSLWNSILTVGYNLTEARSPRQILPGGNYVRPIGNNPKVNFDAFAVGIWKLHETRTEGFQLYEPALATVDELVDLARRRNLELIFVLTPNHAYDDFYVDSIRAWDRVEEWLSRMSATGFPVYSFSQPNAMVYEPAKPSMRYWYDPYHFSAETGGYMLRAIAGTPDAAAPANFAVRMTRERVAAHVAERRAAIRQWARANPAFVADFEQERRKWESRRTARAQPRLPAGR